MNFSAFVYSHAPGVEENPKLFWWNKIPVIMAQNGSPHIRPFRMYLWAKKKYYGGYPIMHDRSYDIFEDMIRLHFPDCPALQVVGTPQEEDVKELTNWLWAKKSKVSE